MGKYILGLVVLFAVVLSTLFYQNYTLRQAAENNQAYQQGAQPNPPADVVAQDPEPTRAPEPVPYDGSSDQVELQVIKTAASSDQAATAALDSIDDALSGVDVGSYDSDLDVSN